jgi:hypothetical protein
MFKPRFLHVVFEEPDSVVLPNLQLAQIARVHFLQIRRQFLLLLRIAVPRLFHLVTVFINLALREDRPSIGHMLVQIQLFYAGLMRRKKFFLPL